ATTSLMCLPVPFVELDGQSPYAWQPVGLRETIEQVVLGALDVDLHDVDVVETEFVEHADDVAHLHVDTTELALAAEQGRPGTVPGEFRDRVGRAEAVREHGDLREPGELG